MAVTQSKVSGMNSTYMGAGGPGQGPGAPPAPPPHEEDPPPPPSDGPGGPGAGSGGRGAPPPHEDLEDPPPPPSDGPGGRGAGSGGKGAAFVASMRNHLSRKREPRCVMAPRASTSLSIRDRKHSSRLGA